MRKRLVPGFKNSQKIRLILSGVGLYCTVEQAIMNFATTKHGLAASEALAALSELRSDGAVGVVYIASNGIEVQVDLV